MASAQDRRDIPADVAHEADMWFVRLGNPLTSAQERAAFDTWLAADPLHRQAFDEAASLWDALDEPVARLARQHSVRQGAAPPRRLAWGYLALAATIIVAILAGSMVWRDPGMLDRAFADHATAPGERRDVVLADGSHVFLDGDSAITVTFSGEGRSVSIIRGRAWFDVTSDAARPFTVAAGALETHVLGTTFAVDREAAKVVVEQGFVSVTAAPGNSARLAPGQAISARGGRLSVPETVDVGFAVSWRRGLIVLDAAPLGSVAEELHHMAPGRLIIPDSALRRLTISGVFQADDPDAVIEAMRTGLGLRTATIPGLATVVYR